MEVGAVKQAFNNEVILLKNNLKQAKIQVIHKLTRKAKTLVERKAPDSLKQKFKRKAESAVKEVLLIKKIKARDIARFIVTHERQLNEYLNKPNIDENKACARLLLHKSLTNKYKIIRSRFANVSINDLLMSRQERRKLKKEAREKQKNKKKKQNGVKADNVGGVWDVEMNDSSKLESKSNDNTNDSESSEPDNASDTEPENDGKLNLDGHDSDVSMENNQEDLNVSDDKFISDDSNDKDLQSVNAVCNESKNNKSIKDNKSKKIYDINKNNTKLQKENLDRKSDQLIGQKSKMEYESESDSNKKEYKGINSEDASEDSDDNYENSNDDLENEQLEIPYRNNKNKINLDLIDKTKLLKSNKNKKIKDNNKNKNLNEKLVNRNFKKKSEEEFTGLMTKIADPFFVTSTGENYMSLVEPRLPDEVKDVHKQGNRQYRRAVMFGHVPKYKPRSAGYKTNSNYNESSSYNNNKPFNKTNSKPDSDKQSKDKDTGIKNNKDETAPEKLHPSWEAKKRQSTIVPYKGKKIMFDDS